MNTEIKIHFRIGEDHTGVFYAQCNTAKYFLDGNDNLVVNISTDNEFINKIFVRGSWIEIEVKEKKATPNEAHS